MNPPVPSSAAPAPKAFASQADLEDKQISFTQISEHAWAYTAEGDPNTGIVIGDDAVLVADTQATPAMAADVIRRIREVTDKPIRYVVLTHYHAVRVLGASAFGANEIIASEDTRDLIVERGEADKASEIGRFPRLFRNVETVPAGMTWPTMTFRGKMSLWLGSLEVQLLQLGRGHTKGDTVVWLPGEKAMLSGDLVEFGATPYAGDAYFQDWPTTLDNIAALEPRALVPGRGAALTTPEQVREGLTGTRAFIADVWQHVQAGVQSGRELNAVYKELYATLQPKYAKWAIFDHCMPFDVSRAFDEASGHADPRVWTAERDIEMWKALEPDAMPATDAARVPPSGAGDPQSLRFDFRHHPDQDARPPARHPVVIVGAGPVGLSLAIDLAQRGQRVVLLDNDGSLASGSRAICFAKRTLEIFDRLGCGAPMVARGVSWQAGRVYFGADEIYRFDLLPEAGHERPAFINLQQYHVEALLVARAGELPAVDLRWHSEVAGIEPQADGVRLTVNTPEGPYALVADHVVACDGSRSPLRRLLGLQAQGRVFRDRFLIADIRMAADLPAERRFWFDPPFHPGQSVLLHRQADGMWRVDFQLGWEADPQAEREPGRIRPRVQAMLASLGHAGMDFEIVWASVYTFACQRMASFRQGRVLFAGDAAHGVSPFGARGANSGVQDADNLGWKLAAVLAGEAPDALLDSYGPEREYAADENIRHSTRATDFITPKSPVSRLFRDAVLGLSRRHPFARALVNSGRLSVPATLDGSALSTPDEAADGFGAALRPGAVAADAPCLDDAGRPDWLLRRLHAAGAGGGGFVALVFGDDGPAVQRALAAIEAAARPIQVLRVPARGHEVAMARYDARPGTVYLLRPDQHVAARWRTPDAARLRAAYERATGGPARAAATLQAEEMSA